MESVDAMRGAVRCIAWLDVFRAIVLKSDREISNFLQARNAVRRLGKILVERAKQ